jgi:ATP-dependent RNA helicase DDX10/DBP4
MSSPHHISSLQVLEKLYRERWGPEDGVGCIILSPTNDLAGQIFKVITEVGKFHNFSGGVIVGKRKGIELEKERVNSLNILVCTPGRLVQHFNETANFDCSQLQVIKHILFFGYSEYHFFILVI